MNQTQLQILANKIREHRSNIAVKPEQLIDEAAPFVDVNALYHTRGLYASLSFKDNGVRGSNLLSHIKYNLAFRPGRAFFVQGVCFNQGYLPQSAIDSEMLKLKNVKASTDTQPYQ